VQADDAGAASLLPYEGDLVAHMARKFCGVTTIDSSCGA